MEYYVVANKNETEFLFRRQNSISTYLTMGKVDIADALKFSNLARARQCIQEYTENRLSGNIEQYQILKIQLNVVEEDIKPYEKYLNFKFTTIQNEEDITKEDIQSMLMFKFGIDKDFDYQLTMTNKRNRTHIAKVKVTFKD